MSVASYRQKRTGLEHRPRGQPLLDGPGRLAQAYGLEGREAQTDGPPR
jgi:hypothetical protein